MEVSSEKLKLNRGNTHYEAEGLLHVRIRVPKEVYEQCALERIQHNGRLDLTDPDALIVAVAPLALVAHWLTHFETEIVPLVQSPEEPLEKTVRRRGKQVRQISQRLGTKGRAITDRLREEVRHLPSHRWEECLTPMPDAGVTDRATRDRIHHLRGEERKALAWLRFELREHILVLDPEAAGAELRHQEGVPAQ